MHSPPFWSGGGGLNLLPNVQKGGAGHDPFRRGLVGKKGATFSGEEGVQFLHKR